MQNLEKLISNELRLVSLLSRPHLSVGDIQDVQQLIPGVNFERVKEQVQHHRVWPCVYCNARDHFLASLPSELITWLKKKYFQNVKQSQNQFIVSGTLLRKFKEQTISIKVLKGIPLAFRLYGDISKRHANDLDLIIQEKDLEVAHAILTDSGFNCEQYQQFTDKQKALYFTSHKDITYHNDAGVIIELHLRLTTFKGKLSDQYLHSLFSETSATDTKILELLYLCLHGSHTLFHRLKWLVDIAIYLEGQNEQEHSRLVKCAEDLDAMRLLSVSWVLCHKLFASPFNESISAFYQRDPISQTIVARCIQQHNGPKTIDSLRFKIDRFCCEPMLYQNKAEKMRAVSQKFKPTALDFTTLTALPAPLFILYYPLRPLLFLYRRIMKTKMFLALKTK